MPEMEPKYATMNGINMHYAETRTSELAILLHSFPDCWYTWRHQIEAFSAKCHFVQQKDPATINDLLMKHLAKGA